jgi:hypothetical protein
MNKFYAVLAFLLIACSAFASVRVLERSANQILLEYRLESYKLSEVDDMLRVDVAGMDYDIRSGAPLLPLEEARIALPPGGEVNAVLISSSQSQATLSKRLLPVPEVRQNEDVSSHVYKIDESLYLNGSKSLLTTSVSTFRGLDFCALHIRPFAYDGRFGLTVTDQAIIRVDISGDTSHRSLPQSDELLDLFSETLINPGQARQWQKQTSNAVFYSDFSRADYWFRLETDREGMFRIDPDQLTGFPLADIDPRSFRLFSNGGKLLPFTIINPGNEFVEVPIRVVGEEDGSFDPWDYIVFYGTTRDGTEKNISLQNNQTYYNPYSGNTVYWLTFAGEFGGDPLRMVTLPQEHSWYAQTSKSRELTRLETETHRREIIGFDWYMTRMFGNSNSEYEFELQLPDLDPSADQALSFIIRQEDTSIDSLWHNINVFVNGVPVQADTLGSTNFKWRGLGDYLFYKNVSSFVSGQNTVRIRVLRNSTDNLFLNWITVDYTRTINKGSGQNLVNQMALNYEVPIRYNLSGSADTRVYRVNGLADVKMVPLMSSDGQNYFVSAGFSNTKYWLSNDHELHSPVIVGLVETNDLARIQSQYDNVIITADEFQTQALSLADMYLQDYGKRSLVVKQSDIFNQFNGGHPDPVALRQFLRYAWYNYPTPKISSVTLIGLGTSDWRNNSKQAQGKNKLIVFQRGSIASDDYFVMLTQSLYPELTIGRYPVTNSNELAIMLSNRENYVRNPQGGWWRNSAVLLADDLYNSSATIETIHSVQTEAAGNNIHPSILTDKIFAWEYEYDEFQNKPGARDDMMAAINEGRLIWLYTGHGAYDKLGAEDYFNGAADMGRFNNQDRLPFFIASSCSVCHFDYWGFESLGQKTVMMDNFGAIASFAASRSSSPTSNGPMMNHLLDKLTNGRNSLGQSIMIAKILNTQSNDNDATYMLMGDPLLNVVPPVRDSLMTVSGRTAQGDTLHARDLAIVSGSFSSSPVSGTFEIKAFNTKREYDLGWHTLVTQRGAPLFSGSATVTGGAYQTEFIVPDDVTPGNNGFIVSYVWDPAQKQDYTSYHYPLALSDDAVTAENPDAPEIKLYIGSYDFRPGDTVGTNTTLYARISDSNGINVTGSFGHNIMLILDNSLQPVPVTDYFIYDLDSYTTGLLTFPLTGLSEGSHTLQLIAFDNFNLPAVASVEFNVKESGELAIERFLIYPNPMQSSTSFTFTLSRDCDLTLDIYSVTGKKIHSFQTSGRQGFNAIPWDGRDKRGDRFANNTYFVKVRASVDGLKAEATERLVIYK